MVLKMTRFILFLMAITIAPLSGAAADGRLPVFVSVLPQQYFVQQIGGEHVDVQVMVPPAASPHTFEPKPRQMADLSSARLYLSIGVPFETVWLEKITAANPDLQVIRMDRDIRKIPMTAHDHGEDADAAVHGDHMDDHSAPDPHIWLSPPLVKVQADTILATLREADPLHAADYERNHRRFAAALDRLDQDLKNILAGGEGRRFMVFHPSWGYFAQAYGLVQVPVEIEGKDPKPAQLRNLIEQAREHGIRVIFVQPQFSTRSAALLAREIGGRVVYADPMAGDWEANLREVAAEIAAALR